MIKVLDELFGVTQAQPYTVTLLAADDDTPHAFPCPPGTTVDDAARAAGYTLRMVCKRGGCGACRADLLSGRVEYHSPVSATKLHGGDGASDCELLCRAVPVTDVVLRPTLGWTERNLRPWSTLTRKTRRERG